MIIETFSEFTYGFALTNEIVGWTAFSCAPIFPNLVEEGKKGGGYDVKLQRPGFALYLQFKRADYMTRSSAREISKFGADLKTPFHRFNIIDGAKSNQHELLLALDETADLVFYAAPRFYSKVEIDAAWKENTTASRSIFVAPSNIGQLDDGPHTVAYDPSTAWVCSEPKPLKVFDSLALMEALQSRLKSDDRPLSEKIPEINANMDNAIRLAELRAEERDRRRRDAAVVNKSLSEDILHVEVRSLLRESLIPRGEPLLETEREPPFEPPAVPSIPTRRPSDLSEPERQLRESADKAAQVFGAQMIVIQPNA